MPDQICANCGERKMCRNELRSWFLFLVALVATIAVRLVTVLMHVDPIQGKIAWYIGVGGFTIFFASKYVLMRNQARRIEATHIIGKIGRREALEQQDYELLGALLCEARSRKTRVNFFIIFALSVLALAIALWFDFVR